MLSESSKSSLSSVMVFPPLPSEIGATRVMSRKCNSTYITLRVLRERMMTDIRMEPLHEASVWTGDQLQDDHSWNTP